MYCRLSQPLSYANRNLYGKLWSHFRDIKLFSGAKRFQPCSKLTCSQLKFRLRFLMMFSFCCRWNESFRYRCMSYEVLLPENLFSSTFYQMLVTQMLCQLNLPRVHVNSLHTFYNSLGAEMNRLIRGLRWKLFYFGWTICVRSLSNAALKASKSPPLHFRGSQDIPPCCWLRWKRYVASQMFLLLMVSLLFGLSVPTYNRD